MMLRAVLVQTKSSSERCAISKYRMKRIIITAHIAAVPLRGQVNSFRVYLWPHYFNCD